MSTHRHFVHYVPRRIVLRFPRRPDDPWFDKTHRPKDGFTRPMYHATRRTTGPAISIARGDTIWIFSQISSPWGHMQPALDGRIDVARVVVHKDGSRTFVAHHSSCWFPLADARHILKRLRTTSASGASSKLVKDFGKPIGYSLQSPRLLHSGSLLERWSLRLKRAKTDFISYRICDGTQAAFATVRWLLSEGRIVFWDRWGLPRRLVERREVVSNEALDVYLMKRLRSSKRVWGIESEAYFAEGSYSVKERSVAMKLGVYLAAPATALKRSPAKIRRRRSVGATSLR